MANFISKRIKKSQTITLDASPEEIFPLFTAEGERAWVQGWNPDAIYPADGTAEPQAVFTTEHAGEAATIWMVMDYDPDRGYVSYLRVTPESRVGKVEVRCQPAEGGGTQAMITYTFTALTEEGNHYLDHFSANYDQMIATWQEAINRYLLTA